MDAPWPARRAADWRDHRRPEEPRSRVRRRARPSLRPERRARHLPLASTAARRSSPCSTRTRTPAAPTSVFDPANPEQSTPTLWEARQGPWENGDFRGPGSGLFKSTDGGTTWRQLTKGLPTWDGDQPGRIGLAVAPSQPSRLFATVEARTTCRRLPLRRRRRELDAREQRPARDRARADAADVVHPTNPNIVFVPTIVSWKSTDGGKTLTGFRGAPGGDDYQRSGSTRTTPTSCCSPPTRAPSSR